MNTPFTFKNPIRSKSGRTEVILKAGGQTASAIIIPEKKIEIEYSLHENRLRIEVPSTGETHFYEVEAFDSDNEGVTDFHLKSLNGETITVFRYDPNAGQPASLRAKINRTTKVKSQMPGKILKVLVKKGDRVKKGDALCTMEAMKMENEIRASVEGQVTDLKIQAGDNVETGAELMKIEPT